MSKPVYSLPQIIEQLRINWGGRDQGQHRDWSDEQEVTYRINSNDKMDAHQVTMARMAYELWDDVVAISMREVSSGGGEVSFAYSDDESYAITYTDEELFGTHLDDADSRFSTTSTTLASANIQFGEYGYKSYVHEIGHALGLTHPGNYDASDSSSPTYDDDAVYKQDTRQYSIMSYFDAGEDGSSADHQSSSAATPLLHDIAAAQAIYGADMTTRTGDTVYGFDSNAGKWIDGQWLNPFDFDQNSKPVIAIWDAGGNDTLNASRYTMNQFIDLRAGEFSDIGGLTKNVAIAFNVTIENAKGGSGDDIIIGNAVGNHIEGLGGNDYILGLEGNDNLEGGDGNDQAYGGVGNDTIHGGAGKDTLLGEGDNDTLWGGADDDFMRGGAGQDVLRGGLGNDTLEGGSGGDVLDGYGEGGPVVVMSKTTAKTVATTATFTTASNFTTTVVDVGGIFNPDAGSIDTASYANASSSVTVNLVNKALNTGDAAGDSYISIERYDLSQYNDGFIGVDSAFGGDWARGGAGNDIMAGMAGNDHLEGQFGNDGLEGDAGNDLLEGGDGNDVLVGGAGADKCSGGAGDDILVVDGTDGLGDTYLGGAGNDTLRLVGTGATTVTKLDTVHDSIESLVGNGKALLGGADATFIDLSKLATKTQVSYISGEAGDDGIVGSKFADKLLGKDGTDILSGLGGSDRIDGGAGRDFMLGGAGADDFDFNSVKDTGKTTSTRDRIGDFKHGLDDIDLKTIDANGAASGNTAFKFLAKEGAAFTGVKGQIHWLQIDKAGTSHDITLIEGDINGDRKVDFQIELTGLKTLTVGDFIL